MRYREARFLPDGKSVFALSDETGEVEFWKFPANGVGKPEQLTSDGKVLRWEGDASPDGKLDRPSRQGPAALAARPQEPQADSASPPRPRPTATSRTSPGRPTAAGSPGRWPATNSFNRIYLYQVATGKTVPLTSDRFNSTSPAWSRDGKWIYFLSDRNLRTLVHSPWGARQPDPYLTATTGIFGVALKKDTRSPFQPPDELHPAKDKDKDDDDDAAAEPEAGDKKADNEKDKGKNDEDRKADKAKQPPRVEIDLDGLTTRLYEVPVPPGNYGVADRRRGSPLLALGPAGSRGRSRHRLLETVPFDPEKTDPKTVVADLEDYDLSADGKKLMIRKGEDLYVVDAGDATGDDELRTRISPRSRWTSRAGPSRSTPREQWQQMFREAWRLERDYFYDPKMHGVDWPAMLKKYRPLSLRVTSRASSTTCWGRW